MRAIFNPFGPENMAEPSTGYAYLLEDAPVHYFADYEPPFYTLSRYDDVAAALRDIKRFSSHWGQGPRFTDPHGMLSDPPQHTFFRKLVQKAFTPRAISEMAPHIEEVARGLLDELHGAARFDVHDQFAFPLPVIIISEMLGVPREDIQKFKDWSDASVEAMGAADPTPWIKKLEDLAGYILDQIAQRRESADPADDLISRLVQVRETDPEGRERSLEDPEILSVVNQLLVGGNETTTSLITNCVWRLLDLGLWGRVAADPGLVDAAIEESLRYDPPVLGLYRTTTEDVPLHGQIIPKDAKIWLHYAAANRDPRKWDDPDTFSLDRPQDRHLAFGFGVHFCLGAELARLEARTALKTLVQRFPQLTLENAGERIKPYFLWGRKHLPVRA